MVARLSETSLCSKEETSAGTRSSSSGARASSKPTGMVGLLTTSGIASDKTAATYFNGVATEGRLKALYDFENGRTCFGGQPFFPGVDSRFKFCALVSSSTPLAEPEQCAFFLQDVSELDDPDRCFPFSAEDFARVNPNTGTASIFKGRRKAGIAGAGGNVAVGRSPLQASPQEGWSRRQSRYVASEIGFTA